MEYRRTAAARSLSKEEGVGRCMFRDQMCAKHERGLAGESLGHRQASEEVKQREKNGSSG